MSIEQKTEDKRKKVVDKENKVEDKLKNREEKQNIISKGTVTGATGEIVERYGSAAHQHTVAYEGFNHDTGQKLTKGLKGISESKVNPDYAETNYKQQAGFSAEVEEVALSNEEKIINGEGTRTIRTDDMGSVNDQYVDVVDLDDNGNIISGSEAQMKFVGSNPESTTNKILSKNYDKYHDNDVSIMVPKDEYDAIKEEMNRRIAREEAQAKKLQAQGKTEEAAKKQKKADKIRKVKNNLKKSRVTRQEAMMARKYPKLMTAYNIHRVSFKAGVQGAKYGAVTGGVVSLISNAVAVWQDEENVEDAMVEVAKGAGKGAVAGFGTAYGGTAIKGVLQNSSNATIRSLSKVKGLPGAAVNVVCITAGALKQYFEGKMTFNECVLSMGRSGMELLSSAAFSVAFQVAIPIPVVGAAIGALVGYTVSFLAGDGILGQMKRTQMAREARIRAQEELRKTRELQREFRKMLEYNINAYFTEKRELFDTAFSTIEEALASDDINSFIAGTNMISEHFGAEVQFKNMDEFDELMLSDEPLRI